MLTTCGCYGTLVLRTKQAALSIFFGNSSKSKGSLAETVLEKLKKLVVCRLTHKTCRVIHNCFDKWLKYFNFLPSTGTCNLELFHVEQSQEEA